MKHKRYKAILCDMDGTIVNSEEIAHQVMKKVFQKHGGNFSVQLHGKQIGKRMREWLPESIASMGLNLTAEQFIAEFHDSYSERMKTDLRINEGFYGIVDIVRKNDLKFILVTSSREETAKTVFKTVEIERELFDGWVTSESVVNGKPDPEPYKRGIELAGVHASECLVLEDSDKGVISAVGAGADAIAIPTRFAKHLDFKEAIEVFPSLADVERYLGECGCY